MRPKRSSVRSTSASTCSGSRTSVRNGEAVVPELGLHVLERLRTAAADRHLGARPRELAGDRAADPGAAAGDERDLAGVRVGSKRRTELAHGTSASVGRRPSSASRTETAGLR